MLCCIAIKNWINAMKNEKKKRKLALKEARKHPLIMFEGIYPGATNSKNKFKKHPY